MSTLGSNTGRIQADLGGATAASRASTTGTSATKVIRRSAIAPSLRGPGRGSNADWLWLDEPQEI